MSDTRIIEIDLFIGGHFDGERMPTDKSARLRGRLDLPIPRKIPVCRFSECSETFDAPIKAERYDLVQFVDSEGTRVFLWATSDAQQRGLIVALALGYRGVGVEEIATS